MADGTLDPARVADVRAQIAASSELTELYERELRVVGVLLHARATIRAPEGLRERIAAQSMAIAGPRRRIRCASALAGALAAIGAAVTLLGTQATRVQQSVNAAAAVGLRPSTGPAPAPDPTDPRHERLAREVDGVHFPDWWPSLGWRAVGQRTDEIGRRLAVTVFYSRGHAQVAYTILASPALPQPRGPARRLNGIDFHTFAIAPRPAVTWRRAELTCVLTGERATLGELLQLAAWNQPDQRD